MSPLLSTKLTASHSLVEHQANCFSLTPFVLTPLAIAPPREWGGFITFSVARAASKVAILTPVTMYAIHLWGPELRTLELDAAKDPRARLEGTGLCGHCEGVFDATWVWA